MQRRIIQEGLTSLAAVGEQKELNSLDLLSTLFVFPLLLLLRRRSGKVVLHREIILPANLIILDES